MCVHGVCGRLEEKGIKVLVERRVGKDFPQFEVFDPEQNGAL